MHSPGYGHNSFFVFDKGLVTNYGEEGATKFGGGDMGR